LGLVSRGHPQQIADSHCLEVVARLGRYIVGEELQYLVVQLELALRDGQADGRGGEAFAQRKEGVRRLRVVRGPPALGDDLTVPQQHDAVQRVDVFFGRIDEREDRLRRDALLFRTAARQVGRSANGSA